jgi:hypothetical protein
MVVLAVAGQVLWVATARQPMVEMVALALTGKVWELFMQVAVAAV